MAELTSSTREAARRLGVSDTTMHKAERSGRITREPDGQWDIAKLRVQMRETADPQRSPLSGSTAAEGTPFARLKVAQLALKVEAQRLALDESKQAIIGLAIFCITFRHRCLPCSPPWNSPSAFPDSALTHCWRKHRRFGIVLPPPRAG